MASMRWRDGAGAASDDAGVIVTARYALAGAMPLTSRGAARPATGAGRGTAICGSASVARGRTTSPTRPRCAIVERSAADRGAAEKGADNLAERGAPRLAVGHRR